MVINSTYSIYLKFIIRANSGKALVCSAALASYMTCSHVALASHMVCGHVLRTMTKYRLLPVLILLYAIPTLLT